MAYRNDEISCIAIVFSGGAQELLLTNQELYLAIKPTMHFTDSFTLLSLFLQLLKKYFCRILPEDIWKYSLAKGQFVDS